MLRVTACTSNRRELKRHRIRVAAPAHAGCNFFSMHSEKLVNGDRSSMTVTRVFFVSNVQSLNVGDVDGFNTCVGKFEAEIRKVVCWSLTSQGYQAMLTVFVGVSAMFCQQVCSNLHNITFLFF